MPNHAVISGQGDAGPLMCIGAFNGSLKRTLAQNPLARFAVGAMRIVVFELDEHRRSSRLAWRSAMRRFESPRVHFSRSLRVFLDVKHDRGCRHRCKRQVPTDRTRPLVVVRYDRAAATVVDVVAMPIGVMPIVMLVRMMVAICCKASSAYVPLRPMKMAAADDH